MGQVIQLRLGPAHGADIGEGDDVMARRAALVPHHVHVLPDREDCAVLVSAIGLALPMAAGVGFEPAVELIAMATGVQEHLGVLPEHLVRAVARDDGEGRVDRDDAMLAIHEEDPLGRGLEDRRGLPQPLLDLSPRGDVLRDPDHAPLAGQHRY